MARFISELSKNIENGSKFIIVKEVILLLPTNSLLQYIYV